MPYPGLPSSPMIVFYSGDYCFLLRDVPVSKRGARYLRLYMILTEMVKWRYDITDKNLRFDLDSQGVYVKEYPAELIDFVSRNPENAIAIAYCNFDGSEVIGNLVAELKQKIKRKDDTIKRLQNELESLQEEAKMLAEQIRLLKRHSTEVEE